MHWGGREGEGGLRYVHWLSERERGVCIGYGMEGARWTEGGRVEVLHWLSERRRGNRGREG